MFVLQVKIFTDKVTVAVILPVKISFTDMIAAALILY